MVDEREAEIAQAEEGKISLQILLRDREIFLGLVTHLSLQHIRI